MLYTSAVNRMRTGTYKNTALSSVAIVQVKRSLRSPVDTYMCSS